MIKFSIVSRDHEVYRQLFENNSYLRKHFKLMYCGLLPENTDIKNTEVLLSEPDIALKVLAYCPALRWLQSTWAGNNAIQNSEFRGFNLTGVKGIFGPQMREYVFAYLLFFNRKIEHFKELNKNTQWQQPKIEGLSGKYLGIMGLGNIGQEIANTAKAFDMKVNALCTRRKSSISANFFTLDTIQEFAQSSDFIVNVLPETEKTRGVCNLRFFEAMKQNSVFINAGRGSIIDKPSSLIKALEKKLIKAAVLDVFENEPLDPSHPYYQIENCFITNHTAAVSKPDAVFDVFAKNAKRFKSGETLLYLHDFYKAY